MSNFNKIKPFLEKENIFKDEAIKGCSAEEINQLRSSTNKVIPEAILDYLTDYGKSNHTSLNLCEIYNRFLSQKLYTKLFKEMKEEYQDYDSFFEIDQLDEKKMLFFSWNGGGHGDYMMSFVYPISEANPTVYHFVEGELQNTKDNFSEFALKFVKEAVNNLVRRIKFDAKKIDEYQLKTRLLRIPNISNLRLEIDLNNSDTEIPVEIKKCHNISELSFKRGSYKDIESVLQKNKKCLTDIALIELNQFPENFEIPSGKELEILSIGRFELENIIIKPANYPKLKTLVINSTKLRKLSREIAEINSLERLTLMKAEITDIPRFLSYSKKLVSLDFWGCKISHMPEYLSEFEHLNFLNISHNFVDERELCMLKKKLPNTEIWAKNQLKK